MTASSSPEAKLSTDAAEIDAARSAILLRPARGVMSGDPTLHICPNCGCDLRSHQPIDFGNVAIDKLGAIIFEGRRLRPPRTQYRIIDALIRARGRGVTRSILADRIGGDINDETVVKYVQRTRESFESLCPSFDQIVALKGFGAYYWRKRA